MRNKASTATPAGMLCGPKGSGSQRVLTGAPNHLVVQRGRRWAGQLLDLHPHHSRCCRWGLDCAGDYQIYLDHVMGTEDFSLQKLFDTDYSPWDDLLLQDPKNLELHLSAKLWLRSRFGLDVPSRQKTMLTQSSIWFTCDYKHQVLAVSCSIYSNFEQLPIMTLPQYQDASMGGTSQLPMRSPGSKHAGMVTVFSVCWHYVGHPFLLSLLEIWMKCVTSSHETKELQFVATYCNLYQFVKEKHY